MVVGSAGIFFDVQNIPSGDFIISLLLDRKRYTGRNHFPPQKKKNSEGWRKWIRITVVFFSRCTNCKAVTSSSSGLGSSNLIQGPNGHKSKILSEMFLTVFARKTKYWEFKDTCIKSSAKVQSHVSSKNPLLRLSRATCLRRLDCYTCIHLCLHFTIMLQSFNQAQVNSSIQRGLEQLIV